MPFKQSTMEMRAEYFPSSATELQISENRDRMLICDWRIGFLGLVQRSTCKFDHSRVLNGVL